ncbi:uncharacterized protein LOC132701261 isoform X2 [Cylas formicarius]|uniref:uncharacterized protein LOC132701261 isoform X2 n=1 Tax=Cylas formicarius TaxID=197179 RepID=UPI00295848C2|nr:uncharacterized protein LOC132701261 isoform X2 [Cylas formicarius]
MALAKGNYKSIPEGAVVLSENEAVRYQREFIYKWPNWVQGFPLKLGPHLLGVASACCGIFYNNYYRRRLRLFHIGRVVSYLPVCFLPATLSAVMHAERPIILLKADVCPVCLEVKAGLLQAALGFLLPFLLAPTGSMALAHQSGCYNMPQITQRPTEAIQFYKKLLKPIGSISWKICAGQALLASFMTYLEARAMLQINKELHDEEKSGELLL